MPSVMIYSLQHSEHPLTTYLHCRWQEQKAQNWCHTKKPWVEVSAQLERNTMSEPLLCLSPIPICLLFQLQTLTSPYSMRTSPWPMILNITSAYMNKQEFVYTSFVGGLGYEHMLGLHCLLLLFVFYPLSVVLTYHDLTWHTEQTRIKSKLIIALCRPESRKLERTNHNHLSLVV